MYAYDGLHRLVNARRGVWTGGLATPSVSQLKGNQDCALDPLGNWPSVGTDLDGAGGIDSDETETRDHRDPSRTPPTNRVNELYARELSVDSGSTASSRFPQTADNSRVADLGSAPDESHAHTLSLARAGTSCGFVDSRHARPRSTKVVGGRLLRGAVYRSFGSGQLCPVRLSLP
jgi:hypothetical protein